MKRLFALLSIAALLFTTAACSEKKPPEPAAIKGKNVLSTLRDMRSAYEKKDLSSFMDNVAPGYPDREALSRSLAAVFAKNETIRFNIQYTKMLIMVEDKGPIKTTFNWDGEWLAVGGTTQKNGGRVTLVFDPASFKLTSIDGKNPFVPQPVETPGKQ
jgi:predicted small lipoprotein YifL